MNDEAKLILIKVLHTLVWIFFNVVILYMLVAAITNKLDVWLWLCYVFVIAEGITLLVFKNICPITLMASRYSNSTKDNFDIYLPNWLAKYTKRIYTTLAVITLFITIFQLVKNQ